MSLFEDMTDKDLAEVEGQAEIGLGEYAGARFTEELVTYTGVGAAYNEFKGLKAEFNEQGAGERLKNQSKDFENSTPEQRFNQQFIPEHLRTTEVVNSNLPKKITQEQFELNQYGQHGLKWHEGMSEARAKIEFEGTESREIRKHILEKGSTPMREGMGFVLDLGANLLDPVNYMGIGPSAKVAGLGKKFLVSGAVAASENLALSTVTRPYWEERGVESTWQDYVMEGVIGFGLGGTIGVVASKFKQHQARKKISVKSKETIGNALNETAEKIKNGEEHDISTYPGFDEAIGEIWNLPKNAAKEQINRNADRIGEALGLSKTESRAQLIPMILHKQFEARELGVDPDELIGKFIIEKSKETGKKAKGVEFDINLEDSNYVKKRLLDSELENMVVEVEQSVKGNARAGNQVEIKTGKTTEKKWVSTPVESTYPKWYGEAKVKNKEHLYKVLKSRKGPVFERLKVFAAERLENGGKTGEGIPFEPSNEWRRIQGLDPVNLQQGDVPKTRGEVIEFDGLEGTIKTEGGELVYFDKESVRKGRSLPAVGEKVELDLDTTTEFPAAETLFQFAGPNAKTADVKGFDEARRLFKEGVDPEKIRKDLGWFQGKDKRWRYEINDNKAKFKKFKPSNRKDYKLGDILDHKLLFEAYEDLKDVDVKFVFQNNNRKGSFAAGKNQILVNVERFRDIPDNVSRVLREIKASPEYLDFISRLKTAPSKRIGDVIRREFWNSDLGKRYAPLYDIESKAKFKSPDKLSEKELRTILHEIQHAIQRKEDFARGGNAKIDGGFDNYQRLHGEVEARSVEARKDLTAKEKSDAIPEAATREDSIIKWEKGKKPDAYPDPPPRITKTGVEMDAPAVQVGDIGEFTQLTLLQKQGAEAPRASITFDEDGVSTLKLLKGADNTSILHETGHEFFKTLENLVNTGKASKQTILDFETSQKWLDTQDYKASKIDIDNLVRKLKENGTKLKGKALRAFAKAEVEKINRHEFFARGFETYLYDGTAPSARVARIFEKFKEWFKDLYHSREQLNAEISPEMKDVYSRLMGGENAYTLKADLPTPNLKNRIDVADGSEFEELVNSYNQGALSEIDAAMVTEAIAVSDATDVAIASYKKAGEFLTFFQGAKKDAAAKLADELGIRPGEAKGFIDDLDELGRFGLIDDATARNNKIQSVIATLVEELEHVKKLEKRNMALSFRAKKELQNHVDTIVNGHYKDQGRTLDFLNSNGTPERAILAILEGDSRMRGVKGAGRAIHSDYTGLIQYQMNTLVSEMRAINPNIEKIMKNDLEFNSNVIKEMWEIRQDGTGNTGVSGDPTAIRVAGLLSKKAEEFRTRLNDAGADIGKLDGWVPRRHDYDALVRGKEEGWIADVMKGLDKERSFPGLRGLELEKALSETYNNLKTGVHGKPDIPGLGDAISPTPSNMAKKVGKKRTLHFKSSEAELAYLKKYAGGYNIVETMFRHMDKSSRMVSVMERLGPNPDATIFAVIEQTKRKLRRGEYGIPMDQVAKLVDQLPSKGQLLAREGNIGQAMGITTGEAQMVQNMTGAKIAGTIRAANSASRLMGATLSQLPDALSAANEMRIMKDQGFVGAWADTLKAYFGRISPEMQTAVVDKLGIISDGFSMATVNRFDNVDSVSAKLNRLLEGGFRLSGMTGLTNKLKSGVGLALSSEFADNTSKSWDSLDGGFREILTQYGGIDANKWDAIRAAGLTEVDGVKYFTPEKIEALDDEAIIKLIPEELRQKGTDGKLTDKALKEIKRERRDLEQAVRSTFVEEVRNAVLEPDARTSRTTTLGHKRGTVTGEAMRLMMQFKSFSITYTQRTLGGRRFSKTGTLGGDPGGAIHHLLMGSILGYGSMMAKDLVKGKSPRDPTSGKTWVAAMAQSGGLGILGDFALGKKSRYSGGIIGTIAGPTAGIAEDFFGLTVGNMHDAAAGKDADFLSDLVGFAQYNVPIPAANLWYTRTAINHLFWFQLREALNPGSMRRMERRIKKDTNQDYFIKASETVK